MVKIFKSLLIRWAIILACSGVTIIAQSQTVAFAPLTDIPTVCEIHQQAFTLINSEPDVLNNVFITVQLSCGFKYIPGSVQGLTESDVSDTQNPVFAMPSLAPGGILPFSIDVFIGCETIDCLDQGQIMNTVLSVTSAGTTQTFPSDLFNVETPRLVITKVNKSYQKATQGQILTRTITVRNTRVGRLSEFRFTDAIPFQLDISNSQGIDDGTTDQLLARRIGAVDFQAIGNKDAYFDFNEEIILTESILVTTCSFDKTDALSTIQVLWGCDTEMCQQAEVKALVYVEPLPEKGRVDSVTVKTSIATCYDGQNFPQSWSMKNTSAYSSIIDLELSLAIVEDPNIAFVPASFQFTLDGNTFLPDSVFYDSTLSTCGEGITSNVILYFPPIPPGKTLHFSFDQHFCAPAGCVLFQGLWTWEERYEKSCAGPGDQFFEVKDSIFNSTPLFTQALGLFGFSGSTILDGQVLDLGVSIPAGLFKKDGTDWTIEINLPCGLVLEDTTFLIQGIAPLEKNLMYDTTGLLIHLTYPLPMPFDSLTVPVPVRLICDSICVDVPCEYSLISTCDDICLGPVFKLSFKATVTFNLDEDCPGGFNPTLCLGRDMSVDCFGPPCPDTLKQYLDHTLTMERLSFGLPDNNNDYLPDPGGILDKSKVRLDRAMPGDTIRIRLDGVVRSDDPNETFQSMWFRVFFGNRGGFPLPPGKETIEFLNLISGFANIKNSLTVIQYATGTTFEVPVKIDFNPYDSLVWCRVEFDSLAKQFPQIPPGFEIGHLDTVHLHLDYLMKRIFKPFPPNYERYAVKIGAKSNAFLFNGPFSEEIEKRVCPCPDDMIEYTCIDTDLLINVEQFPLCHQEISTGLALEYGLLTNFFPNEYRTLIDSSITFCIQGFGFAIDSAILRQVRINGKFTTVNIPLTVSHVSADVYCLELNPILMTLQEEDNIYFLDLYQRSTICERQIGGKPAQFKGVFQTYAGRWNGQESTLSKFRILPWERTVPAWTLEACDQNFYDKEASWNLSIVNCFPALDNLVAMPNVWIRPKSTNNALEDLKLVYVPSGIEVPWDGIRFRLGEIGVCDTVNLRLSGRNTSCDMERLILDWGWSCDSLDLDVTCRFQTDTCSFFAPPGKLEMDLPLDTIMGDLCSPMQLSHSIQLNADLGSVYNFNVTVILPPGLTYLLGTTQIRWPAESGNLYTVNDPFVLPDGRLQWTFDSLLVELQMGLPGVNFSPGNAADLQFQTITDCGFISGSKLLYSFEADQICDRPTNIVAKTTGPYVIKGTSAPYTLDIAVGISDTVSCQQNLVLDISIPSDQISSDSGLITVELPPGFEYFPGSCSSNLSIQEPTIQGNRLIWKLEQGLPSITLSLSLFLSSSVSCGPLFIPVYASVPFTAFCHATSSYCDIEVLTGSRYIPVNISRPEYDIFSVAAVPYLQGLGVQVNIAQIGGHQPGSGKAELWLDLDGDGKVSSGDQFIVEKSFSFTGGTALTLLFGPLDLDPAAWCRVIVLIDEGMNCVCQSVTKPIKAPIIFPASDQVAVCWNDSVQLGTPSSAGLPVSWTGLGLSCTICPTPWFSKPNLGTDIESSILLEKVYPEEECMLIHEWIVDVYPQPELLTPDVTICDGDTATLLTTPAMSWTWMGPFILPGAGQVANVIPTESSTYMVTIIDEAGCMGVDEVHVDVISLPSVPSDFSFCGGANPILPIPVVPGTSYFWKNAGSRLSDVTSPTPQVLIPNDFTFQLLMNNGFCKSEVPVSVQFSDSLVITGLPETVSACKGDTVFLDLHPNVQFDWQPANAVICLDPLCAKVAIPIVSPVTVFVTGTDTSGCTGLSQMFIQPQDSVIEIRDSLTLCPGQSVELFGELVTSSGWYCDTTGISGNCLEITCVFVSFSDTAIVYISDTICAGQTIDLFGEKFSMEGTYCRTTISSFGCDSMVCLTLTVIPDPVVDLIEELVLCFGDTAWVEAILDPETTPFHWSDGWKDLYRPVTPENTYLLITRDQCGQPDTAALVVSFWLPPTPDLGLDTAFCEDSLYVIYPVLADGTVSWMWSDGFPELNRPVTTEGWYVLIAMDSCGQTGVDSIFLSSVYCGPCHLDIPNLFTPNGDGVNDVFRLVKDCDVLIHMKIYDRWGQVVFDETSKDPQWNGIARGEPQPMEVYAYVISFADPMDGHMVKRGDVTLVR